MAKKGKYAAVVGDLPKFSGEEPDRQQLLDRVKAEILGPDLVPLPVIGDRFAQADATIKDVLTLLKRSCAGDVKSSTLAQAYADVRGVKDQLNDWLASAQLLLDAYEQLMIGQMEEEGVTSLNLESGAGVSTYGEPCGVVVDKELFRRWCATPADRCALCGEPIDDHSTDHASVPGGGLEQALQLWPSSMNAIAKERTLAGEPPPPGVEVYAKTAVRLRKA